jgi:hypothetical protein
MPSVVVRVQGSLTVRYDTGFIPDLQRVYRDSWMLSPPEMFNCVECSVLLFNDQMYINNLFRCFETSQHLNRADIDGRRKSRIDSGFRKRPDNWRSLSALLISEQLGGIGCREDTMKQPELEAFPDEAIPHLKTYVYRLIDPRNGETFYIGKGRGNRVFSHIRAEDKLEGDEVDNKIKRIREIRLSGFEVAHVIHGHGMDEKTALEVEAALIDAYPGLANVASGSGRDFGAMHAREIVARYSAEPAVFRHRAILITVNRTVTETSVYEATRYAWKIAKIKAKKAELVLAIVRGLIVGAFIPERWLEAIEANFPGREDRPGRIGFVGREAEPEVAALYVGRRVPDEYRKSGAANPIRYTWQK